MIVEWLAVLLVALLLGVITVMAIAGLLGELGVVRITRCGQCRHLRAEWGPASRCPYCHFSALVQLRQLARRHRARPPHAAA